MNRKGSNSSAILAVPVLGLIGPGFVMRVRRLKARDGISLWNTRLSHYQLGEPREALANAEGVARDS